MDCPSVSQQTNQQRKSHSVLKVDEYSRFFDFFTPYLRDPIDSHQKHQFCQHFGVSHLYTFKVVISPNTIGELVDHNEVEDHIDTEQDEEHEVEIQKLWEMLLDKARRSSNPANRFE